MKHTALTSGHGNSTPKCCAPAETNYTEHKGGNCQLSNLRNHKQTSILYGLQIPGKSDRGQLDLSCMSLLPCVCSWIYMVNCTQTGRK